MFFGIYRTKSKGGSVSKYKIVRIGSRKNYLKLRGNYKMTYGNELAYFVDGQPVNIFIDGSNEYVLGNDLVLSKKFQDLAGNCDWNHDGFVLEKLFDKKQLIEIKASVCQIIEDILKKHAINIQNFSLEDYHKFVNNTMHSEVIAHTKRLYPHDFGIDVFEILEKISDHIGSKLSFFNPITKSEQWIILRINRPNSQDYNPAHKDIYEVYDQFGSIPQMINCWIPICGVTHRTGLPVAPGSHLINEKDILRTKAGSNVNGFNYSVNSIAQWNNSNSLITLNPQDGEAIIFSSHLIHGLARNLNQDTTRISFEFRLYSV